MSLITTATTGSNFIGIDGERKTIKDSFRDDSMYLVDFSKLQSVNDLITVIAAMGVSFHKSHPHFDTIANFLSVQNPIPLRPETAPMPDFEKE